MLRRKKRFFLVVPVAALCVLMCASLTHIDVTQSATTVVPQGNVVTSLLGSLAFTGFGNMDLAQNATVKNQGVSKNQIKTVHIKSFILKITDPGDQTFNFISSLKFFVETTGQERKLIASGDNFGDVTEVGLEVEDVDLSPYVTAASMNIVSEVTGHAPDHDTTIMATAVFDVEINPKGILCGS